MGRLRVGIIGPNREPPRDVPVTVRQKRHFFSFGTGLDSTMFQPEQAASNAGGEVSASLLYQGMVKGMFNSASCGSAFSWQTMSPEPGMADLQAFGLSIGATSSAWSFEAKTCCKNVKMRCPLGYKHSSDELERALKERVQNVCSRYRGRIQVRSQHKHDPWRCFQAPFESGNC